MAEQSTIRPYPADDHDHHDDLYNLGLQADANMFSRSVLSRRRVISMGLLGIGALVGCGVAATQTPTPADPTACPTSEIPEETAGPYPANGSQASNQNLNVLTRSGIQRTDLRTSTVTGNTAAGVPLTVALKLVNINAACAPLAGYAVYMWQCDRDGNYSMYSRAVVNEDYLRGVAATNASGEVTFTTVFPACYSGRWPHIHFEVYPSLAVATSASNKIQTSQLALPQDVCNAVYATSGYSQSVTNLSRVSLANDNVFRDGYSNQMATVTGSTSAGYAAALTVGLAV